MHNVHKAWQRRSKLVSNSLFLSANNAGALNPFIGSCHLENCFCRNKMVLLALLFLSAVLDTFNGEDLCPVDEPLGFSYSGQKKYDEYDYVIVGAGASGSVVASRLSENPNVTVLLMEAGGPPPGISEIPLCGHILRNDNKTEWGFYTEPQENACLGSPDRRAFMSQYKALGGCSTHNGMGYTRGNHRDYDRWAKMGAIGWSWNDVLPIFKFSENNTDPELIINGYHGTDGYQTVSLAMYENKLRNAFSEAGKALGLKQVDYNGPSQIGYSDLQLTLRDGRRCSTEKAFLRPAANRPNFDILTYARVTRIQFDEASDGCKRAKRVVYDNQNESNLTISARREIILSAGAIGSPHILLLSGIGPKKDLKKLGVPVVADLPVGLNFHDHVLTGGQAWWLNDSVGVVFNRDVTPKAISDFKEGKGGVLTSPETLENTFFISTKYNKENKNWPDIQLVTRSSLGPSKSKELNRLRDFDIAQIYTFLVRPKSRGFVKLRTTNPYDNPIVDPQFLSEKEDLKTLVEGMKMAAKLFETPALQRFGPVPLRDLALPAGCNASESDWNSEENLACLAQHLTASGLHLCCSNKMGNPDDKTTVVDPNLRVKGVKGLRVADASIMPTVVSGNTVAPCIMIGEKAARMIAQEYKD